MSSLFRTGSGAGSVRIGSVWVAGGSVSSRVVTTVFVSAVSARPASSVTSDVGLSSCFVPPPSTSSSLEQPENRMPGRSARTASRAGPPCKRDLLFMVFFLSCRSILSPDFTASPAARSLPSAAARRTRCQRAPRPRSRRSAGPSSCPRAALRRQRSHWG